VAVLAVLAAARQCFQKDAVADTAPHPILQDSNEPPIKKLAIREEEPEEDKFDFLTEIRMYEGERDTAEYVVVDEVNDKVRPAFCSPRAHSTCES